MESADDASRQVDVLRDRLSGLRRASLRINESLDFENVLREVVESALTLTGARYGVVVTLDDSGMPEHVFTAGMSPDQRQQLNESEEGLAVFDYLRNLTEPLRVRDYRAHLTSLGLPEFCPVPVGSFMAMPIRHRGEDIGTIFLGNLEGGEDFGREDEETLVMFGTQAALVIANARTHRDEQRARADLEAMIDTSPVGVGVFDARRGALVSLNREARRMLEYLRTPGCPIEQLFEVACIRRADGREMNLAQSSLVDLLIDAETVRAEEIVVDIPDGRSLTVLLNATPIHSDDGKVDTVVVTLQDIAPLEELERLRAEFLGIVGHELRMPLTAIKGSAATLLEAAASLDEAEVLQFYRIINEQADYMRDLISDLIDVVRIETGALAVSPEPSDLSRLVDEARNNFLSSGGRDNIRIALPPDLPLVAADRRRIVQVLSNLLSNASRNSHEASIIRVSVATDEHHIAISVSDDGRGVPPERLPDLFRKFSRIENQERGRDLGMGLAICKGIVEAHGGRIWAESDGLGLGSRFTFTLPQAADSPDNPTGGAVRNLARPARAGSPDGLRVLAVDDDPRALKHIRDSLSKAGYEPIVTADPSEVASVMETSDPHVVILDLMLPGTDGIELMRDILAVHDVPVIFLSAYDQDGLIAKAFEMGAVDYVVKPFTPTELAARVRAALRKQREPAGPFRLGDLVIDYEGRTVAVDGRQVELTATEFNVLAELSVNAGVSMSHDQLLQRVWGRRGSGDSRPLRTVVKLLRGKLGDDARVPKFIFTVPRVGYRMPKAEG